jgi:8-oxo-dGTP pyrophosphatase MutT (NUDIX family)
VSAIENTIKAWQVKESELVLDHPWARVRRDACILPDGSRISGYYYWEGGDFAQVFALTAESRVVLVRQYKHAVKEIVLELPAGMVAGSDTSPLETAQRELLEETGFESGEWKSLGALNVGSAKFTTRNYPFLALNVERVSDQRLDDTEAIEILLVTMPEMLDLMTRGVIKDANSLATCLLALRVLGYL